MIESINKEIAQSRTFLITTHESPDGDAVGSTLALASYLLGLGKEVTLYYKDSLPDLYTFLPLADTVRNAIPAGHYDVCGRMSGDQRPVASLNCSAYRGSRGTQPAGNWPSSGGLANSSISTTICTATGSAPST